MSTFAPPHKAFRTVPLGLTLTRTLLALALVAFLAKTIVHHDKHDTLRALKHRLVLKNTSPSYQAVSHCQPPLKRGQPARWGLTQEITFFKVRSQSTQDGVLAYLFQNLGVTNKFYVEFGFNADSFDGGTGANTYTLWKHFGWTGLLLDGGHENPAINLHKEMVTPDNIVSLFDKYGVPKEPDYVSVDVDSIDLWLFRALVSGGYRPRVVTIEYNINFPIDANLVQAEDAGFKHDYAFGASLKVVAAVAEEMGYVLVHVVKALDAVLVRRDLMEGVAVHPLEAWAACCTNQTVHAIPDPDRVAGLLDYSVLKATGDVAQAKAAARRYLDKHPYLMSRPQVKVTLD